MSKKFLIFIAAMLAVTTLFAEIETMTCESEEGTCVYELDGTVFHEYCTCEGGSYDKVSNHSNSAAMPTELDCSQNTDADVYCKEGSFACDSDAGRCHVNQNGKYLCNCWGVYSVNGAENGVYSGTTEFSEESCRNKIVELCGTERATLRDVCEDMDIFNECVNYIKPVETCFGRWSNECIEGIEDMENEDILDFLAYGGNHIGYAISDCCQIEDIRKEKQTKWECLDNCTDEDCCQTCGFYFDEGVVSSEEGSAEDADVANTEVPTDGATATAEKEESKSDGCSMLFI